MVNLGLGVKQGATVHFRNGGKTSVKVCDIFRREDRVFLTFKGNSMVSTYSFTGKYGLSVEPHPFDITAISEPPFDWDTAEWGMAFINKAGDLFHYLGKLPCTTDRVAITYSSKPIGNVTTWNITGSHVAERVPQRDIKW